MNVEETTSILESIMLTFEYDDIEKMKGIQDPVRYCCFEGNNSQITV